MFSVVVFAVQMLAVSILGAAMYYPPNIKPMNNALDLLTVLDAKVPSMTVFATVILLAVIAETTVNELATVMLVTVRLPVSVWLAAATFPVVLIVPVAVTLPVDKFPTVKLAVESTT
jgi:hypothetical protein